VVEERCRADPHLRLLATDANKMASAVHDRMPVILPEPVFDFWLNPKTPVDKLQELLRPAPENWLDTYPVSRAVNVVKTNGPPAKPMPTTTASST